MRPKKVSDEDILTLHEQGKNQKEIAATLGVTNVAIHYRLKKILVMQTLGKLTDKEQRFCLAVSEGKSRTAAAMEAYDCTSRESAKALQNTLMDKPEIQESIASLMDANGLTRAYRLKILKKHIDDPIDSNASLRGLDMSFKLAGEYPPQKSLNLNVDMAIEPVDLSEFLNPNW